VFSGKNHAILEEKIKGKKLIFHFWKFIWTKRAFWKFENSKTKTNKAFWKFV